MSGPRPGPDPGPYGIPKTGRGGPAFSRGRFTRTLTDLGKTPDTKLRLGEALDAFGKHGFGAALLILGLMNMLPLPPGSSTVLGLPVFLVSVQLAWGVRTLSLPAWVSRGGVSVEHYRTIVTRLSRPLSLLEAGTRPRLDVLVDGCAERAVGVVCAALAVILMLPLWGGNLAPALIVSLFGLGLMQRDGLVVLLDWLALALLIVVIWFFSDWVIHVVALAWDRVLEKLSTFRMKR